MAVYRLIQDGHMAVYRLIQDSHMAIYGLVPWVRPYTAWYPGTAIYGLLVPGVPRYRVREAWFQVPGGTQI